MSRRKRESALSPGLLRYDWIVVLASIALLGMGLVMIASASIPIADSQLGRPFYYLQKQVVFLGLGLIVGWCITRIDMQFWQRIAPLGLCLSFILLVAVLLPGLSHDVNGSQRWLQLGLLGIQVSEFVKLGLVLYLADYLVRHANAVKTSFRGFCAPLVMLFGLALLLLFEPDFGAVVVLSTIVLGVLFLAGAPLKQFFLVVISLSGLLAGIATASSYRWQRITAFLDPWAHPFDSGYQLVQSLIAFGRGEWLGVGLGGSLQKLFYLPEAHTDFLLAVIGEEMGLLGVLMVMLIFSILVARALLIGREAHVREAFFSAYVAYGISLWLAVQALINMGVNVGLLPTKGLTLPLLSYGGSSLLASLIAVALLLRIAHENQVAQKGAVRR